MGFTTNVTYNVTCDWCKKTVAQKSQHYEVDGVTRFSFGQGSPGVKGDDYRGGSTRSVYICDECSAGHTVFEFIRWLSHSST